MGESTDGQQVVLYKIAGMACTSYIARTTGLLKKVLKHFIVAIAILLCSRAHCLIVARAYRDGDGDGGEGADICRRGQPTEQRLRWLGTSL